MTDNIVSLVTNKEDEEDKAPPSLQEVLDGMIEHGEIAEGVIIALHKDEGGLMVASNLPGIAAINMLLDTAKMNLLTGQGAE